VALKAAATFSDVDVTCFYTVHKQGRVVISWNVNTFSVWVDKDWRKKLKLARAKGRGASFSLVPPVLALSPRMLNNARVILFGCAPMLLDASLSTDPEKPAPPHLHIVSERRTTFSSRLVTMKYPPRRNLSERTVTFCEWRFPSDPLIRFCSRQMKYFCVNNLELFQHCVYQKTRY